MGGNHHLCMGKYLPDGQPIISSGCATCCDEGKSWWSGQVVRRVRGNMAHTCSTGCGCGGTSGIVRIRTDQCAVLRRTDHTSGTGLHGSCSARACPGPGHWWSVARGAHTSRCSAAASAADSGWSFAPSHCICSAARAAGAHPQAMLQPSLRANMCGTTLLIPRSVKLRPTSKR